MNLKRHPVQPYWVIAKTLDRKYIHNRSATTVIELLTVQAINGSRTAYHAWDHYFGYVPYEP